MSNAVEVLDATHDGFFGPLQMIPDDRFQEGRAYQSEVDQLRAVFDREGGVASVVVDPGSGRHLELLRAAGFGTATDRPADAAILLSSRIGREVTNLGILDTLGALSARLRPGGLLLFDILDGEAVLRAGLPRRGLTVTGEPDSPVLCGHTAEVLLDDQVLRLTIRAWRLADDRVVAREPEQAHDVRYFLPRELRLLLAHVGFEQVGTASLAGQRDPAWLRLVWARKS